MYTLRERAGSNCRGKQGKTALDGEKLKAILEDAQCCGRGVQKD